MTIGHQGTEKARAARVQRRLLTSSIVLALATLAGCAKGTTFTEPAASIGSPNSYFLEAASQTSDGKSINIDQAVFRGSSGWVAIHANGDGAPGVTIGVSKLLPPGKSVNIIVPLNETLRHSGPVFAVLHLKDNHNSTYEFPKADAPATFHGQVVVLKLQITVAN
jgi:hypothetical protein